MIEAKTINELREKLKTSGDRVVKSQDNEFSRKILEQKLCNILVIYPTSRHTIKHIDSGLNSVLAKLAAKNNIQIGLDIKHLKKLAKKDKANYLSSLVQNIKLCRKSRTQLVTNSKKEAFHLLLSLGASTQQTKEAQSKSF